MRPGFLVFALKRLAGEALGDVTSAARQIPVEIVHAIRDHKDLEEVAGAYKDIDLVFITIEA